MTELTPQARAFERAILKQRALAQADCAEFFSAVFLNPEKPAPPPMRAAAHQKVGWEFMEAHPRGVLRWPTDTGKTLSLAAYLLWKLGRDRNLSALLVGKVEDIAQRSFRFVRQYLEDPQLAPRLRAMFPELRLTDSDLAARTTTSVTVERPAGGADPSIQAIGTGTAAQGKKPKLIVNDDLLDGTNTQTGGQRRTISRLYHSQVVSRLVGDEDGKVFLVNVPFHEEDLTFELEEDEFWPTLHMDLLGNVRLANTDWTTPLLRPSRLKPGWFRLAEHDSPAYAKFAGVTLAPGETAWFDEDEQVPLFPERWPRERIEDHRSGSKREPPSEFARSRLCQPMSDEEARCHIEWIDGGKDPKTGKEHEGCLVEGRPMQQATDDLLDGMQLFVGADFGFGEDERLHDRTAFFVLGVDKYYLRHLVWLESEHGLTGPDVVDGLRDLHRRFRPRRMAVESNGAQKWASQFVRVERKRDKASRAPTTGIRIEGLFTTQASKLSKEFGVETLFTEFAQSLWRIPCNAQGVRTPEVQAFVDECLAYRPGQHPGDRLMAGWIAHEIARRVTRFDLHGVGDQKREKKDPTGGIQTSSPDERWRGAGAPKGYSFGRNRQGY